MDFGGPGRPLLALHGHYNEALAFAPLAAALAPGRRVIALDQRGHGESDRAHSYGRDEYVADVAASTRLPGVAPSREALAAALGAAAPYVECSFRQSDHGWGFSFDIADTVASQKALNGDHWVDWISVTCPTLLVHGTHSDELAPDHAHDMVTRRAGSIRRVELPAGHVVHHDVPIPFTDAVTDFLSGPC